MKRKYRYRDDSGCTRLSLERAAKHLHKLGELTKIRGYLYFGRYNTNHTAVMVHGTKGTARFSGFAWGYAGQGPRGLDGFLASLGVDEETINTVVSNDWQGWSGEPRQIWEINLTERN